MKKIIISIIVIGIVLLLIALCKGGSNMEIKSIKSFSFFYTTGYAMNADVRYEVECTEKCIAKIKLNGVEEEKAIKKEVSSSDIRILEDILNKYNVNKWDGFNKTDKNVLDGNSFSLNIVLNDKSISASGYMKWPNNYGEFKKEIDMLFATFINE